MGILPSKQAVAAVLGVLAAPLAALSLADLQTSIDGARPGQTIVVPRGDHVGQLVLSRPVVLRGEPGARLVHLAGAPAPTLWVKAAGARVEDLEVYGSGQGTRRDNTAVVVSAPGVTLTRVSVSAAWAGLWIEKADSVRVEGFRFRGLSDYPFWERGEGVKVSGSTGTRLSGLDLAYSSDGILVENSRDTEITSSAVAEARYGVHLMFGSQGRLDQVATRHTVVGLMAMETSGWSVVRSSFTEGYRTGSAGIRQIRSTNLRIEDSLVTRHSTGIELLEVRDGLIRNNRIEENASAWTWGGDNTGTLITANRHQGNLADASGVEYGEGTASADPHAHGASAPAPAAATGRSVRPVFDGNFWDAWKGLDLDGDGFGDTPHRFDRDGAIRTAARPWTGLFLGSPWSLMSQRLPGGEVLDPRPRSR